MNVIKRWFVQLACRHDRATLSRGYAYVILRCPDCDLCKIVGIEAPGIFRG